MLHKVAPYVGEKQQNRMGERVKGRMGEKSARRGRGCERAGKTRAWRPPFWFLNKQYVFWMDLFVENFFTTKGSKGTKKCFYGRGFTQMNADSESADGAREN